MQKLILHFGNDPDNNNILNLIVKLLDVPINQLEACRDYLQSKGFEIYSITHNSIEEMLTGVEIIRELDKEGWVWREAGKVHINRNTQ